MTTTNTIPFNRACTEGNEIHYLTQAIAQGNIAGDHAYTRRCQALLQEILGAPKVLLTTSCTHALEMSAILINIQPGDEVILPAYTFVSTANAFVLRGATPIFCDIRPDTLNIDETRIESLITHKTKAIIPVHYAGVACEMDAITALAHKHNLTIIEDNAHGLFGKYKDRWLGTLGSLATQSFHETKNLTCGEGGALIINDPQYIERAEIIREKGTNRSRFYRGQVDKYSWVDMGSSYILSDILAAFLLGQLEAWQSIQQKREHLWESYYRALAAWAGKNNIRLPIVPSHCEQTYHMFYLLMPDLQTRTRFIAYLKEHHIQAVFHYLPLHKSTYFQSLNLPAPYCPVSEAISDCLVRLPFYNGLAQDPHKMETILDTILQFKT